MRLHARLPEELSRKLEALKRATGQSTSDVVRAALERYFNEICGRGRSARDAILGSGLVGCGEAETDLSTTYKSRLHEGLRQGYPTIEIRTPREVMSDE
jgi:Arc/MetJ-type ribon-helix-helix transcriptional regulator